MKPISHNPYRIAGILSNTSQKDLLKQKSKIKRFSEIGKTITSELDFPFLDAVQRENVIIDKAFSEIEQNQNKVRHSLYWFLDMNTVDSTAIQYLINGDKDKALEIWGKFTNGKEINSKNFSAFNNIGTLYLLGQQDDELKKGIESKIKLIESESFKDYVYTVADQTAAVTPDRQIEIFVNELLKTFKGKYSVGQLMTLFNNCNGTTQKYLSKHFSEEPIHKIEAQIEKTRVNRSENKSDAYKYGNELYNSCKNDLVLLKSVLGVENLQYKMVADNLAKELLQCSIDYFNENQNNESDGDYLEDALKLAKISQGLAVNKITQERIKDNISTLSGMKDREIRQAIEVLQSIKKAYESNEAKIMKQVSDMRLGYNQSVNWTKVNDMIANSLDWHKVVQLIKEVIPPNNVQKIKNNQDQNQIREYQSLVGFLFSKLGYSLKNQVKYLNYWETLGSAPTKTVFKNTGSSASDPNRKSWREENPGCFVILVVVGLLLLAAMFSFTTNTVTDNPNRAVESQYLNNDKGNNSLISEDCDFSKE
ncbi:MAG: hypothetical protein L6264_06795 [Weeksellaceae bacterium]|nr:hypothetical protein [Bacteroidota bacterium]MCG2780638.1 hypothetical protein [Weeksellaceae bacterium]